jgi:phage protein D
MRDGNMVVVGMSDDIEYAQMIWTSVYLGFTSKLDPTWDVTESAEYNIKVLKESGRKWIFIKEIADRHGFVTKPNDGKLKAAYRRQCKAEGVEPTLHTNRHFAYRQSYAEYFQKAVINRLNRQYEQQEADTKESTGAEVALRDSSHYVDEEFYALYPDLRPRTAEERHAVALRRREEDAEDERRERERRAALTPSQRDKEDRDAQREYDRWQKFNDETRRREYDERGANAGTRAGNTVDLTGGKNGLHSTNNNSQIGN